MCTATHQYDLNQACEQIPLFISMFNMLPQDILSRDHAVVPNSPQVKLKKEEQTKMI